MKYPYADLQFFTQHKHYSYAKCTGNAFYQSWIEHRENKIAELQTVLINSSQKKTETSTEHVDSNTILLDKYLADALKDYKANKITAKELKYRIQPLQKKFEVFKKLHVTYNQNLRKTTNSATAATCTYMKLAKLLIILEREEQNFFYLSTLLKLTDALCSLKSSKFDISDTKSLLEILTAELDLIKNIL